MKRYIAVDTGKFATKSAEYIPDKKGIIRHMFETKTSRGDFRDDSIERETFIAEVGGVTYKIGHGASGYGAALETNKATDTHKLATLAAIATFCSDNEEDEIYLATGLPAKEWADIDKREHYKAYFPRDPQTVKLKRNSAAPVEEKHFVIRQVFAFPESIGALLMDDSPQPDMSALTGVLDLGRLNLNATIWQGNELIREDSVTDELGSAPLVQGLSQELTARFSRCSERYVDSVLKLAPDMRYLPGDERIQAESHKVISDYLIEHAEKVKRCCDARRWSLDYMRLIAIGGTSVILKDELKQVFGDNLVFLKDPAFVNVCGYLRLMCSRLPEFSYMIPLKDIAR